MTTINFVDYTPPGRAPLDETAIRLHGSDQVAIAKTNMQAGTVLELPDSSETVTVRQFIPAGHKVALADVPNSESVRRYGQIIGFATQPIASGEHVHSHNLGIKAFDRDYAFGVDVQPVDYVPPAQRRTFMGYKRANGRVGTRNTIALIAGVNCSAHTSREIARHFTPERLAAFPNVDGVIALTHHLGCTTRIGGDDYRMLQRTLAGMARSPNVGAFLFVGLGCETNQIEALIEDEALNGADPVPHLVIQDTGGIRKTVAAGIDLVESMLPQVDAIERSPQPISQLMLALECGGSDSWSGITANPLVGLVADELVRQGGTVVISETPEVYGAEHMLTRRAVSREVGQKLVDKIKWWEAYTRKMGLEIDNNPSPGYDPVSITGKVAGGCNLVLFTTGRGSVFGFKPAPSIKIATNSVTFNRMEDDMDLNAGKIQEGVPLESVADELLDLVVAVAGGQPSKSEAQGVGEAEFNPWTLGGMV